MIKAENLVKSYNGNQVLKGVSLKIENGGFVISKIIMSKPLIMKFKMK